MHRIRPLLGSLLFWLSLGQADAALYTVSPTGNDTNPGSDAAPWRTLTHAASVAVAGDTVELLSGTYAERVTLTRSGTASAPIVFCARAGNTPVINGSTLSTVSGWTPLVWLAGVSHVTIEGIEFTGLTTATKNHVPIGILVTGSGDGVNLLNNHIHHLGTTYTGANGGDAHGIAIYGDSTTPITGLVIRSNHLHDLTLGSSEALVINGNVDGFLVESNRVDDCNNIGIDAIGHEDTCPDPAQDAARNGIIRSNTVTGIRSYGNPAYGNNYSAGGIYVDGGRDILIERNTVSGCDIGIELASEHAGQSTSGVHVRNNVVYQNRIGGLYMGGYDRQRGSTENCIIRHNTFWQNDTLQYGNGEIYLQFDVRGTDIRDNIIVTNAQNLVIGNIYVENNGNTLDYNLVYTPGTPRWQWKNVNYTGLAAWRTGSGQGAHTFLADPLLLSPSTGDFSLRPKSPAIDAGDPTFTPAAGERDHADQPRLNGSRSEIGAREFDLAAFSAAGTPSLTLDAGTASLTINRRTDWSTQGLDYVVETSTTLAQNSWSGVNAVSTTTAPVNATTEHVTFNFTAPTSPRWFVRARISVAP